MNFKSLGSSKHQEGKAECSGQFASPQRTGMPWIVVYANCSKGHRELVSVMLGTVRERKHDWTVLYSHIENSTYEQ